MNTESMRADLSAVIPNLTSPQARVAFDALLHQKQRRRLGSLAPGLLDSVRQAHRQFRAADIAREHRHRTRRFLARLAQKNPRRLSDADVWSEIDRWMAATADDVQPLSLLRGVAFHEAFVRKACAKVGWAFEQLVDPQLALGERSTDAQQTFDLIGLADQARQEPAVVDYLSSDSVDLSRWRKALAGTAFFVALDAFLDKYGHRGRNEYDWSLPRYREDPSELLHTIRVHLRAGTSRDDTTTHALQERAAAEAWARFEARLSRWQKWTMLPAVRRSIRRIKQYRICREQVRSNLVRMLAALRVWHLVLAERFVQRGWLDSAEDYFLLQLPEIASVIRRVCHGATLGAIASNRRAQQITVNITRLARAS